MILLITTSQCAQECANAISESTGEPADVADSLVRAASQLRVNSYSAVVLDQSLLETTPDEADMAMDHAGTAVIVPVNLALCGRERLVRQVQACLKRRQRERIAAREAVLGELQSALNRTITGMMLSIDLALQATPPEASERLRTIRELMDKLYRQLESIGATEERTNGPGLDMMSAGVADPAPGNPR